MSPWLNRLTQNTARQIDSLTVRAGWPDNAGGLSLGLRVGFTRRLHTWRYLDRRPEEENSPQPNEVPHSLLSKIAPRDLIPKPPPRGSQ